MVKTIWIINEYAGSVYHGMEFRHYYLGKELAGRGYNIFIITASYSHLFVKRPEVNDSFKLENIDGINYLWVRVPKYGDSHDKKRVLKWIIFTLKAYFHLPVEQLKKPDIIIVSPMATFPILAGYKWAKRFNAELLYEVKDIWPLTLMEIGGYSANNPFILLMQLLEKFAYNKAKRVISVLPLAYKHMIKYGMDINKFKYIPNGIYIAKNKHVEQLSENIKQNIPKDKFLVIYAGTFGKANALEHLIYAISRIRSSDIHFLLIGKGMEEDKLRSLSKELKLDNITFLPPVSKGQIYQILQYAHVCYIGWRKENIYRFGISANKIFDYMYSAKPILHSFSGDGDLVQEARCGLTVEAEDSEAIAKGILELYSLSKMDREQFGLNGKNYVIKYHSYEKIADDFEKVFGN